MGWTLRNKWILFVKIKKLSLFLIEPCISVFTFSVMSNPIIEKIFLFTTTTPRRVTIFFYGLVTRNASRYLVFSRILHCKYCNCMEYSRSLPNNTRRRIIHSKALSRNKVMKLWKWHYVIWKLNREYKWFLSHMWSQNARKGITEIK